MSSHSKFSPSGAARWLACPGSLTLPVPEGTNKPSSYAEEGTAAHALAHRCWLLDRDPSLFIGMEVEGVEVTEEMANAVQIYLDTIDANAGTAELEVRIVSELFPEFGGTVDALIHGDQITVVDFKYGAGVPVEVAENPQLCCYALLALAKLGRKSDVKLIVVQPRATHADGPVRTWVASKEYLSGFYVRVQQVLNGERENEFKTGDHCRWCPAKLNCSHLHELSIKAAQAEFAEDEMSPERAAELLQQQKAVKAYFDAVERWVHGQLDKGKQIPGYKLVQKFGNRRWAIPEVDIVRRCRNKKFGKKMIYHTVLKSPAQLEKVVGKDLVGSMVERPDTGTTVVPESDKRPAVIRKSASEEFEND